MASILPGYVKIMEGNYDQDRATAVARTAMEDGMVKQLQTMSRVLVTRNVTLGFATLADYQNFITFFQITLQFGSQWFTFVDPVDSVSRLARFVSKLGKEQPLIGTAQWRVAAAIETWSDS